MFLEGDKIYLAAFWKVSVKCDLITILSRPTDRSDNVTAVNVVTSSYMPVDLSSTLFLLMSCFKMHVGQAVNKSSYS